MARLIHLNGPPGIGKSTLARCYIRDHPLAFCLDIDGFRRLIGGWETDEQNSGRLARLMAVQMALTHLGEGFDVVIPQYVARPEFVFELAQAAAATGAEFFEVVLLASVEEAESRFESRASDPTWMDHHKEVVAAMGMEGFRGMYARLVTAIPALPQAVTLPTRGAAEDSYQALLGLIGQLAS